MSKVLDKIIAVGIILLLLFIMYIVEKNVDFSEKLLKVLNRIFIPISLILTIIKWIETGQFLGEKNSYSLFLIISLVSLCSELLNKFIPKYFRCYSMNDIYFDESNYRYVIYLTMFNLCMVIVGIVTVISFINDFIIKISIW
ncbi:MAG: hypothetical protein ACLSV2_04650 [Clostridium sp.]